MPAKPAEDFLDELVERIAARIIEKLPPPPPPPAPAPQQAEYLSTGQLAKLLGLSPGTLEGWRARGKGPPWVKIGTVIRYSRAGIDPWAATHARKPK